MQDFVVKMHANSASVEAPLKQLTTLPTLPGWLWGAERKASKTEKGRKGNNGMKKREKRARRGMW